MNLDVLITGGVGLATSTISAIVTWALARRKYNSEVDANVILNMQKSLDFYRTLVEDNKERLLEILKINEQLETEVRDLRKQVYEIMGSICYNMTCQHRQLTKDIKK